MHGRQKLRKWLEINKLRQEDFANQLGTFQPTVHRWLAGDNNPSWPYLRKIHALTSGFVEPSDWLDEVPAAPERETA